MDADIQIMVAGTVQMDCQVCDSVTLSFLTHGLRHLCQNSLWLGQALPQMGVNFCLAGGAKGTLSRRTSKGESCFAFFADRSFCVTLQPFEQLNAKFFHPHPGLKSCLVVAVFLAYSK